MSAPSIYLVRVEHDGLCFGFVVSNGIVIAAAPVARWTLNKQGRDVVTYWRKKGGTVAWTRLPLDEPTQDNG